MMKFWKGAAVAVAMMGALGGCLDGARSGSGSSASSLELVDFGTGGETPTKKTACTTVTSSLDIDVPRVQLSGTFTVNGAAPLASDNHRGKIELRSETLGVVDLGSVHYGTYSRWIVPGVYDVVYKHLEGDILPRNSETVLSQNVNLTLGGTFDINITSVLVMGEITLNGAPAPGGQYEQGKIRFRDRNTGAAFDMGVSMDGSYAAMVIPGEYDVVWSRNLGDTQVPRNTDAILQEQVVVAGFTEIDVDILAVSRTGQFKINSELAPASLYENGQVYLRDTKTGDIFPLGQTRDQTYSILVVPGTYDVIYSHLIGDSQVPGNAFAVVAQGVDMTGAGAFDVNIQMIKLTGQFSLDGGDFPGGAYDRARLWLRGQNADNLVKLGTTESSVYQALVVPGVYDVVYQKLISNGMVPENEWSVVSSGNVLSKGKGTVGTPRVPFNVAVYSGFVAADVTVWGEAPLVGQYQNASILARAATGEPVTLGYTNQAGGSARVLAGTYGVHYSHLIGDQVAFNDDAKVGEAVASFVVTPVAIDLEQGALAGNFKQGGAHFPASLANRGKLSLRDQVTKDVIVLGATHGGSYDRVLLGGTYDILYDQVTGNDVVRNRGAKVGCVTFAPPAPVRPLQGPGSLTGG